MKWLNIFLILIIICVYFMSRETKGLENRVVILNEGLDSVNTALDSIEWQRFIVEFDDSTSMFGYMKRISDDSLYIWPRIDSLNNEQLRILFELFKKHNYER